MTRYGILNLNKPVGMTSRRAVDCVQKLARRLKAGHAGTLDPLASGVLVVCVGAATRLIEHVQRMPKSYRAIFLLGRQSPTEDVDGEVVALADPPVPSGEEIAAAAARLTGTIEQRPPAYSALKIDGERAYARARRGESLEMKPRTVHVYRLDVLDYQYPRLELAVECGAGTYVRSLGRDLAQSLGTAAVLERLVRTTVGEFRIEAGIDPRRLYPHNWTAHLLPARMAVSDLPAIALSGAELAEVGHGRTIHRPEASYERVAGLDPTGELACVLIPTGGGRLRPELNLPPPAPPEHA